MKKDLSLFEIKIDNSIQNAIKKIYGIFENEIYLKISLTFLIVSGSISLVTSNMYWLILSFPFTIPWFILLFIMSSYLCLLIPYTMTVRHLVEHKITTSTARLIALLVQVGVLTILFIMSDI